MQEKKKLQINKYLFISIVSICAGIFVWWLVTDGLGIFRSNALPSPVKVASTFVKKWFETKPDGATLLQHLGASLQVALGGSLWRGMTGWICWFVRYSIWFVPFPALHGLRLW